MWNVTAGAGAGCDPGEARSTLQDAKQTSLCGTSKLGSRYRRLAAEGSAQLFTVSGNEPQDDAVWLAAAATLDSADAWKPEYPFCRKNGVPS